MCQELSKVIVNARISLYPCAKNDHLACINKSFLLNFRILDEDQDEISDPHNSVMASLSNAPRGFKFILWLQNCCNKVRKDLNEDFLVECGVLRLV